MSAPPGISTALEHPHTHKILQRVHTKLVADDGFGGDPVLKAAKLTGLSNHVVNDIKNGQEIDLTMKTIDRSVIHKQLYNFYVVQNTMPSTKKLFNALKDKLPAYMDIAMFRKILYKMDYVWKKIGFTEHFVLMERPELTLERYKFLKEILENHEKNVPTYFVEEWVLPLGPDSSYDDTKTCTSDKIRAVFAFSKSNIIFRNSILAGKKPAEVEYKDWIIQELIPTLEPKSIIVVNTNHYLTDLFEYPTITSLRVEMTDWLDRHDVPYDEEMSKFELFSLIQEYTDLNNKRTTLDHIIRAKGHTPMRVPSHMHLLTPGKYLYERIRDEDMFDLRSLRTDSQSDIIHSKMSNIDSSILASYVYKAVTEYVTLFSDEIIFDEKLETLLKEMEEMSDSDENSDVPSDSDSD